MRRLFFDFVCKTFLGEKGAMRAGFRNHFLEAENQF